MHKVSLWGTVREGREGMKHVVLWQKQLLGLFESATELISDQKYKMVELKLEILIKTTKNAKNVPGKLSPLN